MATSDMLKKLKLLPWLIGKKTFSLPHLMNRTNLLFDYLYKRQNPKGYPNIVEIEVSSRCNMKCIMCARERVKVEMDMSIGMFEDVIDQLSGFAELVILHASGEPLMNKHIFSMIEYCHRKKVGTWLSTNGMLLNERNSLRMLNTHLDGLVIAIDGNTKETYEKIRVGGKFEVVERNTRRFLELHREKNSDLLVSLQLISMQENKNEIDAFKSKWAKYPNANVFIKPFVDWSDQYEEVSKHETNARFRDIVCDRPWNWMIVKSDGTIPLCAHDIGCRFPVGNVGGNKITDIWSSDKMNQCRTKVTLGKRGLPLCRGCDYHPARERNLIGNLGLVSFDALTIAKLLFIFGYKK